MKNNNELLMVLLKLGFEISPFGINSLSLEIKENDGYHLMAILEPKEKGVFHFSYRETWGCKLSLSETTEDKIKEIIALVKNIADDYEKLNDYTKEK